MKKAFLLLLVLCLLCSCGTPEESDTSLLLDDQFDTAEFLPEYDFRNEFGKWRGMCESEQAYYLFSTSNNYLHYYDKESGISGILCGKPDCDHSDTSCNAYFIGSGDLMYYDGYIYSVQQGNTLIRIKPDGTERETVQRLQGGIANSVWLHRGYIYSVQSVSSVVDGVSQNLIRLTQEVLGDAEQEAKTILEVVGNDYFYQVVGNTVYVGIEAYTLAEDSSIASSSISLYAYDSASGSLDKLAESAVEDNYLIYDMRYNDNTLYFAGYDITFQNSSLARYHQDTASIESVRKMDIPMMTEIGDHYVLGGNGGTSPSYCIKDFDGNLIREGLLFEDLPASGNWTFETKMLAEDQVWILCNDINPDPATKQSSRIVRVPLDPTEPVQCILEIESTL